jgi:hypothetical protein
VSLQFTGDGGDLTHCTENRVGEPQAEKVLRLPKLRRRDRTPSAPSQVPRDRRTAVRSPTKVDRPTLSGPPSEIEQILTSPCLANLDRLEIWANEGYWETVSRWIGGEYRNVMVDKVEAVCGPRSIEV